MSQRAQMLKGLLEGCILRIIAEGESYGYKITESLNMSGFADINEGSVYPVLIRLEKKGYVIAESRKSALGPKRKYFSITQEGKHFIAIFEKEWALIEKGVNHILKGGGNDEKR